LSCREFITGSKEAVSKNVELMMASSEYKNPTETMPVPPPPLCTHVHCKGCNKCTALALQTKEYQNTVDDLLLKSNVHIYTTNRNKDETQNRLHSFTECLDNIWQKCKARFPRPLFQYTKVDKNTGSLNFKKRKSMINTFTYPATYPPRCNTDTTSSQSDTAIKAVLLYVSNHITKPALKTHIMFDTIRSVFQKNAKLLAGNEGQLAKACQLITKIINSLSAKGDIGGPMIGLYLLDNPDHYASYTFVPFYWQSFVSKAHSVWNTD
jgi:hypothetical protein